LGRHLVLGTLIEQGIKKTYVKPKGPVLGLDIVFKILGPTDMDIDLYIKACIIDVEKGDATRHEPKHVH
jgi:hypothetical protein